MDPLAFLGSAALASVGASFGLMVAWCSTFQSRYLWQASGCLAFGSLLLALLLLFA